MTTPVISPDNRGVVVTDKEQMYELVSEASRAGFPSTIHAIGDRAVHDVLDVYESVLAHAPDEYEGERASGEAFRIDPASGARAHIDGLSGTRVRALVPQQLVQER